MQRKDAEVSFFIKAIEYEKHLQQKKHYRKMKNREKKKPSQFDFQD
jgi:hypothetical protein